MIGFLAASPAERRLIPGGRLEGPTPYVIAIMMFVMVVIGAAGLALANSARLVAAGVDNRYSVEIADGAVKAGRAQVLLRAMPGVTAIRPVSEDEMRKILTRWLGPTGAAADLPLPAIIDVDLAADAQVAQIAASIERQVPGARFVAHKDSLGPVLGAVRALGWLALTLVVLIALATAAAVVLAARGTLDTHRSTIEVMHGIGATDDQVARLFQRKIALDALTGGTVGAVAAGAVLLLIAGGGSTWLADLTGGPLLALRDIVLLALLPLLGTILATIVARTAVLNALRASL
ncbi:MAG: cell division protein [Pseudomonadota bacterium]